MIKSSNKFIYGVVFVLIFLMSACVTTRQQLNEKNGITDESDAPVAHEETPVPKKRRAVKSEDLNPEPNTTSNSREAEVPASPSTMTSTQPTQSVVPMTAAAPGTAAAADPGLSISRVTANGGTLTDDELKAELARVSGRVEELEHEKQSQDQAAKDEMKKYQDHIAELEKQIKANQPPPGPSLPEGKSNFEAGKDAYFAGKYEDAIAFFDQYLQGDNLKAPDEATYWRAEANFKQKNYKKAIVDFSKFPEKYQKSSFHPKALLGIAQSFEEMGMKDDAKAFYSDLAEKYPKTAEGKLAKKKLKSKKG